MRKDLRPSGLRTRAVHAGERPDPVTGASAPNLVTSTTFIADADAGFSVESLEGDSPFFYTRWSNPTIDQLERKLADLESAEACVAFASGMAAVNGLFFHHLNSGDRLVISDVTYAATAEVTNDLLARLGIEVIKVNMSDLDEVRAAVDERTRLIFAESPCNPILRLADIGALAKIAHEAGCKLAVDSTLASPIATQPLTLGADYVIHSLTKYLCGHGDAIGGAVLGNARELTDLRKRVTVRTGGALAPFNAWLIMRGIATLPLRMKAHEEGAMALAQFLEAHPMVRKVVYPGLPSHPQHELAKRQMSNFSGMVTFQVDNADEVARALSKRLKVIHYAVSLGHQRSLIFYLPTESLLETSFKLSGKQLQSYREFAGGGIFRFSVGIEDPEDLRHDLEQALTGLS